MTKDDTTTSFQLTIKTDDALVLKEIADVIAKTNNATVETIPIGCQPVSHTPFSQPSSKASRRGGNPNKPVTPRQVEFIKKLAAWNDLDLQQDILDVYQVPGLLSLNQSQADEIFAKYKKEA